MTALLWAAIGMAIGAAVLHGVLGLRRPLDRTYTSFATVMVLVAVFLYYQAELYRATTVDGAVETTRRQVFVILLYLASLLVFVPAYTRARLPRPVHAAYGVALAVTFVANLVAPYSLWYAAPPQLAPGVFLGEPYTTVIAPPMGLAQLAFSALFTSLLLVSLGCAVKLFRRGERQRAATLAIALTLVLVHGLVDVIRDNVGGSWPYIAEFGVVTWGLIMAVQLAHDYRAQAEALARAIGQAEARAARLRAMLDAFRALEQNIHAPLGTLETRVSTLGATTAQEADHLPRLRRAVARLRELSRSMPDVSARSLVDNANPSARTR